MKKILVLFKAIMVLLLNSPLELHAATEPQLIELDSTVLKESRKVIVSLPPNYQHEEYFRFPVLYLTDASSQMEHLASMVHYLSGTISPMIVVGIYQTDRFAELAPFDNKQQVAERSEQFRRFIAEELKPYIDSSYRTADFAILTGHSLGGAFTLNAYYQHPQAFAAYIALAPSLAWGNEALLTLLPERFAAKEQPNVAISFEGQSPFPTPRNSFNALSEQIAQHKHLSNSHVIELLADEDHMSVAHLGMYRAVKNLYQGWFLSMPQALSSDNAVADHYQALSNRLGYQVTPTENELWALASAFINQGNLEVAAKVAEQAKHYFPQSHFSYSLLADVAVAQQQPEQAAKLLRQAIALSAHLPKRQARYQQRLEKVI